MPGYYDNPATTGSKASGDYNIKRGEEISPEVACAVMDAVANACALHAIRNGGRGPDFEMVKKLISAARFGASAAANQIEWVNGKVRESQNFHRGRGQHATAAAPPVRQPPQPPMQDFDDDWPV